MSSLVSLTDVVKTYPGPLTVLKDVNLVINAGEDVAVVGPSGSGKTTMLSIMGTLDRPTSGEVRIDDIDAGRLPEADRAQLRAEAIGFVFQQFFLLPTLSALENVAEGMLYQGLRRPVRKARAMEALDRVGLSSRAAHLPGELSGGEQQRVAIARAIAGGPRLLFADEPTGALDQASGHMVVDYLLQIAQEGTTVVVITHDQGLASRFSRQISLLDGQIVADSATPAVPQAAPAVSPAAPAVSPAALPAAPPTGPAVPPAASLVILPQAGSPPPDVRGKAKAEQDGDPASGRMTKGDAEAGPSSDLRAGDAEAEPALSVPRVTATPDPEEVRKRVRARIQSARQALRV